MAFTEAQKVQLRKWTGYPDALMTNYTWLEAAFIAVGGKPEAQAEVESILAKLALVDPKVDASMTTAGLKMVGQGEAEWFPNGAVLTSVGNVGRMYCLRLCTIFNVPMGADPFASGPGMSVSLSLG